MSATRLQRSACLLAFLFAATAALAHVASPAAPSRTPKLGLLPMVATPWLAREAPPLPPDAMRVLGADQYVHRYYQGSGAVIEMDAAYYARPQVGANMHSPLNCLPGSGWALSDSTTRRIATAGGEQPVQQLWARRGTAQYAMTYWFQSRSRISTNELSTRFYLLRDAFRREPGDAVLVRLMMRTDRPAAEHAAMASLAASLLPALDSVLHE